MSAILLSLKTAVVATIIVFILGVCAARSIWGYRGRGKAIIEAVLTAPLVLPPTVVGFLLLLALGRNGVIGSILAKANIRIVFTWYAVVIAAIVVSFPLMYKTALASFNQIDKNLLACGRTLGASEWTIFWRILLPLARPGLIAGSLLSFARALGEFGATIMLAGAIPGKTETIPIAIYLAAESGDMDRALGLVVLMLVISLTVIALVDYWQNSHNKLRAIALKPKLNLVISQTPSQFSSSTSSNLATTQETNLIVDIEKQLKDFTLRVNFTCDRNPLGILGASGAGKTTIMRCLAGLETPDRGKIVLNNRVLFDSQQKINLPIRDRNCGLLFQDYALFPHLTVAENVAFGLDSRLSQREQHQAISQQLYLVELSHLSDRYPHQLSGGQQQRVALARLRASQPEIMLLDEPFSALDTYLRHKQEKLLRQSLQTYPGITILITHNLEEAYRICPNLLVLDRGKAIANDTKANIFHHAPNLRTAQVTNCKNFSDAQIVNHQEIYAINWQCNLVIDALLPSAQKRPQNKFKIGIRAHQIVLETNSKIPENQPNVFNCWLAGYSETQHRVTCYLKLHQPPQDAADYHLQVEILQDKWQCLQHKSLPWQVQLKPERIMVFDS